MLSDERIRQIAEDIYCSEGTRAEIEHSIRAALAEAAQAPVMGEAFQLDCYDAGLLGYEHLPNAEQWHDYIRSELARAHDFYQDQFDNLCSPPLAVMGSPVAWTSPEWLKEKGRLHGMTREHPSFKVPLYLAPTTSITQAELERLRKDAERYKWLKSHANIIDWRTEDEECVRTHSRPTLDFDIDSAMERNK